MIRNFDYYLLAFVLTAVYWVIAWNAWRHRAIPGATALLAIMLAAWGYAIPYLFELASPNLQTALFWYNVSVPGASILGPGWLVFAFQYSRQDGALNRRRLALLGLIPAATCLAAWSNPLHGWYGSGFTFDAESAWPTLEWTFGAFYWINFSYAYLTTALGMAILIRMALQRWRFYRTQTVWLLAGTLLPIALNLVYHLGYSLIPRLDVAPFTFLVTGVCWSLAIFRSRLLDIAPIARDRVFEIIQAGVIAVDQDWRVVDANPAAERILELPAERMLGQRLPATIDVFPAMTQESVEEICLREGQESRFLEVLCSPMSDRDHKARGALLMIQDITLRKGIEIAEREQRSLQEALQKGVTELTRTLKLEEVLDLFLANLYAILPYASAHIVLLDKGGQRAQLARFRQGGIGLAAPGEAQKDLQPVPDCSPELIQRLHDTTYPFLLERCEQPGCQICRQIFPSTARTAKVAVPMRAYGTIIGFLVVENEAGESFNAFHLDKLHSYVSQAAIAVDNALLFAELSEIAQHDELTGALNRRGFLRQAQSALAQNLQANQPCALALFDVDHFKTINDTYGHSSGDQVLRMMVRKCFGSIREADILGRYGGDEFMIFMPGCSQENAIQVGERLRTFFEDHPIRTASGQVPVTISMGIAIGQGGPARIEEMLDRADYALYAAKDAGRNCVRCTLDEGHKQNQHEVKEPLEGRDPDRFVN